jgi:6,7-dimethyl-8-ribityllumazine synthase
MQSRRHRWGSRGRAVSPPDIKAKGLRIGIVVSRFNAHITERLLKGAEAALAAQGVDRKKIRTVWVPGAFEIPILLQKLARSRRFDGLIALGAVIRGETPHFDYVAAQAARGTMKVMLGEGIPVAFGILTTDNVKQALERAGGRHGNKGEEAALVAIEMAKLVKNGA